MTNFEHAEKAKFTVEADAIIFDKDGTLLDFDAFWIPVTEAAVRVTLDQLGVSCDLTAEILCAFGVQNGVTSIDGVMCCGTYKLMTQVMYEILCKHGYGGTLETVELLLARACEENTSVGVLKPTSQKLLETLAALKSRGKRLAVVTTDSREITLTCLKSLGIAHFFDTVYTDDGDIDCPPKPSPYCLLDFCKRYGVDPARAAVVGDTLTDVRFAKNAGAISIALAKAEHNANILSGKADMIISDLAELIDIIH